MSYFNKLADRALSRILRGGSAAADYCENTVQHRHDSCTNGCWRQCSRTCRVCIVAGTFCGAWSCTGCNLC